MRSVGPGPRGLLKTSWPQCPHLRNQEQPTALPATQHPALPVVTHTVLLLTGEPPSAHPLSGEVEASPPPPCAHFYRWPHRGPTAAPPSRRGGLPLVVSGHQAVFNRGLTVADLHNGREAAWPVMARDLGAPRECMTPMGALGEGERTGGRQGLGFFAEKGSKMERTRPASLPHRGEHLLTLAPGQAWRRAL